MNGTTRRIVLGIGAATIAVALAGATYAAGQNSSPAQGPGFGQGGPGRAGGPGGRGGRGGPGGPGLLGPMMVERLDLTTDQRDRVKQIVDSHRQEQEALAERGMAARNALETAITASAFDESLVRARAADVAAVDADLSVARARIYAQVFQILTSEQQTKLKTLQTERQQRESQMRANRQQRSERRP